MAYELTHLTKLSALQALAQRAEAAYAKKSDLDALEETVQGIVSTGGEANVLEGVKVNGTALEIAEKMVDILIATGATNGTLSVNGTDIAVKGLAALAYKAEVGEAELSTALKAVIDAKAAQSDVTTLIGSDAGKSIRTIANEELAAQLIPESAAESLDTLTEIAAWIQAHPDDAAAMNQAITSLTALVGTIPEEAEASNVVAYIAEAITNALASYYTKTQIDGMIATDAEVTEMLDEIYGPVSGD